MGDRSRAVARYRAYIEEVKAAVPPERLLVFQVTEGWAPLCRFLGMPEPSEPFPGLNSRPAIKQSIRNLIRRCYVTVALYAAAAALIAGALYRALR